MPEYKLLAKYYNMLYSVKNHENPFFLNPAFPPQFTLDKKNVNALVLPHAGSEYVHKIIDWAMQNIDIGDFTHIVLLTTNHSSNKTKQYGGGVLMLNYADSVQLIEIPGGIPVDPAFFNHEHSHLSILPYLAKLNLPCGIIAVGDDNYTPVVNEHTLLIANTDLIHCGPEYNNTCDPDINGQNLKIVDKLQAQLVPQNICGTSATAVFFNLINRLGYNFAESVYLNSTSIKKSANSVGYAAIMYTRIPPNIEYYKQYAPIPRRTLLKFFNTSTGNNLQDLFNTQINNVSGIFVTINKNGKLRGCLGTFKLLNNNVTETIIDRTIATATQDTRFLPVTIDELPFLTFKINFLSKPREITNIDDIVPGRDGIILYFTNGSSATFLASVLEKSFNIKNIQELKAQWPLLVQELALKAGSSDPTISRLEIYECIEI